MRSPRPGRPRSLTLAAATVLALATAGAAVPALASSGATASSSTQSYLVLFKGSSSPADAAALVSRSGGTTVADYSQIGVLVARSSSSTFAATVAQDSRVEGASATGAFVSKLRDDQAGSANSGADTAAAPGPLPNAPASDTDTLSPLQWDMRQIKAPQAHAVTGGSQAVVVGDIDTGLDFTHPDLAPNYDAADSANCLTGAPAPLEPGNDGDGHGTHTAGTIAAASNGIGIVGVAPNVRIAGIKAGTNDGFFFPEAVVCAFMWAGSHHIDVTNNSYFADPYQYNCRNDAVQRAIWKAEQRAIRYAMNQGTTVVAAEGNESQDLSHPTVDPLSPDNATPVTRDVTNACVVIPTEISGVVGVTADGHNQQPNGGWLKSFYSSYGVSTADVVAPGGDSLFGVNAEAPNGRVLSAYSSTAGTPCRASRTVTDPATPGAVWCYLQGTSMAAPHVAGVAALIVSRYGKPGSPQNGLLRPGQVGAWLSQTADPQPCPSSVPAGYDAFTQYDGSPQACQGGTGHNSWYGDGQVDALTAVTR